MADKTKAEKGKGFSVLTLDEIYQLPEPETETVEVTRWGRSVEVRSFTKAEHAQIQKDATKGGRVDNDYVEKLMMLHGVVSPPLTMDAVEYLWTKDAASIQEILLGVLRVSGLQPESEAEAEDSFPG